MRILAIFGLLFLFAGCLHSEARTVRGTITQTPVGEPGITSVPATAVTPHEGSFIDETPIPVVLPPKVVKVKIAAYKNAKGEAFPATEKYVYVDQGGWNMEALRNPDRAFVPAENCLKPQNAPGVLWGSLAPGEVAPVPEPGPTPVRKLFDLDQVRVTGFMDRADEAKARREAARISSEIDDPIVTYDDDLGWIIVPKAALLPVVGVTKTGNAKITVPAAAATTTDEDVK